MTKVVEHTRLPNFSKAPRLDFLRRLTTPTGVLQHTKFGVPERDFGYSLDDNARALIASIRLWQLYKEKECLDLAVVYLSFLRHAKRDDGFFNNFQTFDHKFITVTSEDAFGECIWALSVIMGAKPRGDLTLAAKYLFEEIRENIQKIGSPRAKAYLILGLSEIARYEPQRKIETLLKLLTNDLIKLYERYSRKDWIWFEPYLTYANHIIPAALFSAYEVLGDKKILKIASRSFEWLERETKNRQGVPSPIGSNGWYILGGKKAIFDQQPVDPAYAVLAHIAAFSATKDKAYLAAAKVWLSWFYGNNIKKAKVYEEETGACYDAITAKGLNLNQGAESIICYLIAYSVLARILISQVVSK